MLAMKRVVYFIILLLTALSLAVFPAGAEEAAPEQTGEATAEPAPEETPLPAESPVPTMLPGPSVRFTRDFSSGYAEYGEQITLSYTVRNDGLLPIEGIIVRDGLVGEVGQIEKLEPGEKKTVSARVNVTESCWSTPEITYIHDGQEYTEQGAQGKIGLADVELKVELDADKMNVAPGETVTLRLRLINEGNVNLYGLRAEEPVLGDMGSLVSLLAPGDECAVTRTVQMKSAGTFQFSVTGSSDTGGAISVQSNEMSVLVTPVAAEVRMALKAEADQTMLSGPGAVNFSLYLNNECSLELRDVLLSEETRGEVRQLVFVPTGEMPVITAEYDVEESGIFRFMAQVTDSVGDRTTVYSEPIEITVAGEETQAPQEAIETAAPEATMIPLLDGVPYRLKEDPATFEKLMLGASLVLAAALMVWYLAAKWKRFVKRRRARKRKKQKKDRSKQANAKK